MFRRIIRSLVAATAVVMALSALASPPAQAAAPASADVCFRFANGAAFNKTTYVQQWTGSAWRNIASDSGTINGCQSWTLRDYGYIRFVAQTNSGRVYWIGTSAYDYVRPGSRWNFGTTIVKQYSF